MLPESLSRSQELDNFIVRWNNKFPLDYWWRNKHGVAFNSEIHRSTCPIDIYIESREQKLIGSAINKEKALKEDPYNGEGGFLKKRSKFKDDVSQDEIEHDFENMEI